MSHSLKVVRMAAVCCAMTSWAAILRRSGDIFLRVKRSSPTRPRARGPVVFLRARGFSWSSVEAAVGLGLEMSEDIAFGEPTALAGAADLRADRAFSSVVRRFTAGERTSAFGERLAAGFGGSGFGSSQARSRVCFFAGAVAWSSIMATTSPIFTSWPSSTFVSSTPAFSAVISVETLSVSRVNSASPASTYSPDFLCQTETTPLSMDSPTGGDSDFDAHGRAST